MNTVLVHEHRRQIALLGEVISLFKLRIGLLIAVTAVVGFLVTPGNKASTSELLVLALATLLASASAGAFNQYYEYRSDALMKRTSNRAFVTGALKPHPAWLILMAAMLALAVAVAWVVVNPTSAIFVFLGAFFYAVVYTVWLKRRSWLNIVVGGLSGSFAVLAGAALANPQLGAIPWLFAAVLFLWTPPHFWSLAIAGKDDYARAGIPMLPVVVGNLRAARIIHASTWALVLVSLLPALFGAGLIYLIGALLGGGYFLRKTHQLTRLPDRQRAIDAFLASLVQLCTLLTAACIDAWWR